MRNRSFLQQYFLLLFLFIVSPLIAQQNDFRRAINPFQIRNADGAAYDFALLGGFNQPRPQFVDFDLDGDADLFVQESGDELIYFENTGSATMPQLEWRTDHFENLHVGIWFKFADIDADGDADLLTDSPGSLIRIFRNENNHFELVADSLVDTAGNFIITDFPNIPEVTDIDCDGDLDLFFGLQTGAISFYENMGMDENNLPRFAFVTNEFQNILIVGIGKRNRSEKSISEQLHGASALTFADIDNDGAKDMFWGDFFSRSLYFLENLGTCTIPRIAITTNRFPPQDTLLTGGFNIPHFVDIDGDGDLDLFAGVLGGAFSSPKDDVDNFYFYENNGTPFLPAFKLQSSRFLSSLDIGESTLPALTDFDGDGDLDLFIGNEADTASTNSGHVYLFENIGSAQKPEFMLKDSDFLKNDSLGFNPSPAFVDIDADQDLDLFIGEFEGNLNFFRNTGSRQNPSFQLESEKFADIDIGNNSMPAFADVDNDGDFDLFVGEFFGNIDFFRNDGSANNPLFVLDTTHYFGIDVGTYSSPAFVDADGDGDLDLYIGTGDGELKFYRNIGSVASASFEAEADFPHAVMQRATPVIADLDADSDLDLLAGGSRGGLFYFENTGIAEPGDGKNLPATILLFQNYPNPFNPETIIRYQLTTASDVTLTIFDQLGRKVMIFAQQNQPAGIHRAVWDGRDAKGQAVASGIYLYRLKAGTFVQTRKMLLIR